MICVKSDSLNCFHVFMLLLACLFHGTQKEEVNNHHQQFPHKNSLFVEQQIYESEKQKYLKFGLIHVNLLFIFLCWYKAALMW